MTDSPMIFSEPMICALIAGQKTQTRLVIKPHKQTARRGPSIFAPGQWADSYVLDPGNAGWLALDVPYAVGDRLWVREKWSVSGTGIWTIADARRRIASDQRIIYAADGNPEGPWWASTQMPREFSRFTLTVTEVRVQRLQDISETDAIAEGVYFVEPTAEDFAWNKARCEERGLPDDGDMQGVWMAPGTRQGWGRTKEQRAREQWGPTAAFAYRCVWDSLHGAGAWALNPWVCALTFTVEQRNIDEVRS